MLIVDGLGEEQLCDRLGVCYGRQTDFESSLTVTSLTKAN